MPHLGDGISWLYICSFLASSYPTPSLHVIVITSVKNPDILATQQFNPFRDVFSEKYEKYNYIFYRFSKLRKLMVLKCLLLGDMVMFVLQ